jgi:hypothetical protein
MTLYERDYYLWINNTVQLLQQGRLSEIDITNPIEEVGDMGKSERIAIESPFEIDRSLDRDYLPN